MKEIWKRIPGYKGHYLVSNFGRVRTRKGCRGIRDKLLACYRKRSNPYVRVGLQKDGKRQDHGVHWLVWITFVGPIPDGLEINHKNGRKQDNWIGNLELMTHSENVKHAYDMGLIPSRKGEGNVRAVLTKEDVLWLRKEYARIKEESTRRGKQRVPPGTILGFASRFNLTTTSIKMAISGESWGHL